MSSTLLPAPAVPKAQLPAPRCRFEGRDFRLLARRLGLVLGAFTLARAFFALNNLQLLAGAPWQAVAQAFWLGLRYDVSAVLSINLPFIAVSVLPLAFRHKLGYRLGLKVWFLATNAAFLLADLADAEYSKYTRRRTGVDVLGILPDVVAQAPQLLLHYAYIPTVAVALGYVMARLYAERIANPWPMAARQGVLAYLVMAVLVVLGIRGTTDERPLGPGAAYGLQPSRLGTLALNTPFVFFKSLESQGARTLAWAGTPAQARAVFTQPVATAPPPLLPGYNVVVVLLESFGTEYTALEDAGTYTPFFDSLARAGTWLPHFYANGRRSIEAMPAVYGQIPSLEEEALITGPYAANTVQSWVQRLGQAGYSSAFYHGGHNGTMGFNVYARQAGFARYVGKDEYPGPSADYDGHWGIFDRPFLQFVAQDLGTLPPPFVAGLFTLSSHQPYKIEPGYEQRFSKGTLPIHESLGYADEALRQFFASAKRQPWYDNTLFVLTADHTQQSESARFWDPRGSYDVPCVLLAPGRRIGVDTAQARQHADIGPTVLDLLGITAKGLGPFGQSMLRPTPSRILSWADNQYMLIERAGYTRLSPEGKVASTLPAGDTARALRLLKAGSQVYTDGLRGNSLYR